MALMTCVYAKGGTLSTPVAVTASDTISGNDANAGADLTVFAGATPTNVTIADPGHTPAGDVGTAVAVTVAANTSRTWGGKTLANYVDPVTGLITVNYSSTTGVTALLTA